MTGERGVGREPHCACVCVCVCCECAATGETVDSLERQNADGPISFLNCGFLVKKRLKKKRKRHDWQRTFHKVHRAHTCQACPRNCCQHYSTLHEACVQVGQRYVYFKKSKTAPYGVGIHYLENNMFIWCACVRRLLQLRTCSNDVARVHWRYVPLAYAALTALTSTPLIKTFLLMPGRLIDWRERG